MSNSKKIKAFWHWFQENIDDLSNINQDNKRHKEKYISNELAKIKKGLSAEINEIADYKKQLIISADGLSQNFPLVNNIADNSPKIKGWKITAFKQRINKDFTL